MRIVYYTGGLTGAGRLIIGISIGNALIRKNTSCQFSIIHTSPATYIADEFNHIKIPLENENELSRHNYKSSILYKTIKKLKPDLLIVNHQWFMLYDFINELQCKKIYLSDLVYDSFFKITLPERVISFRKDDYDRVFAIEPFKSSLEMEMINPLIVKNLDEILPKNKALQLLGLKGNKKIILFASGAYDVDFNKYKVDYDFLDDNKYEIIHGSMKTLDYFPLVDLYNAFDIIIGFAGYNQVWEAVYFGKKAFFKTASKRNSDQAIRIKESKNFSFKENGADTLVDIIMSL